MILRAYVYILLHGKEGLEAVSEVAVLNSNYLARKISNIKGFTLPYAQGIPRKHEFVISASQLAKETGVTALQVAKRLLDYGIHPPTIYFPMIVEEALMIEPTETVSKYEMDNVVNAFQEISRQSYSKDSTAYHQSSFNECDPNR